MTRVQYKCTATIVKGMEMSHIADVKYDEKAVKIRELKQAIKEDAARAFSSSIRTVKPCEVKISLVS